MIKQQSTENKQIEMEPRERKVNARFRPIRKKVLPAENKAVTMSDAKASKEPL